tara:strand:- start:131 stop:517 length:387 start_codon:yes stop_codon:yes gene_type:complete
VYTKQDLRRGRFIYFGQKKKNKLYELGKKNFNSYAKPKSNWNGTFQDFNPFGDEYTSIKKKSLQEALHPEKKGMDAKDLKRIVTADIMRAIVDRLPINTRGDLAKAMDFTPKTLYNYLNTKEMPEIKL